jgi:hypothetical protein
MDNSNRLIITAASKSYGKSLLALLGSLTLNWSQHPPVLVYDIGLDETTRAILAKHHINVKRVPPFRPHWRKHFTWKVWCWNDAPARDILWMDAGVVVLQPLDEVFETIDKAGYFVATDGGNLMDNASAIMCQGCGLEPSFRKDKATLYGGILGFRKQGIIKTIVAEALQVAWTEEHIAATEPLHRHDQALVSLLFYKHLETFQLADVKVYLEWQSPRESPHQKVWIHRRAISAHDAAHFAKHIETPGAPYLPSKTKSWRMWLPLYQIRRWLAARNPKFLHNGVRD